MVAAPAITAAAMLAHRGEHDVPTAAGVPLGLGPAVALLRSWAVPVSRNTTAGVVALADAAAAAGAKLEAAQDAIRQGGTPVPQGSALIAERDAARAAYVDVCATAATAIDAGRAELAAAEPELQVLLLRLAEAEAAIVPPEREPGVPSIGPPEACIAAALTAVRSWEDHIAADSAAGAEHLQDSLAAFFGVCARTAEQLDPSVLAKELPAANDTIIAALAAEADRAVSTAETFPVAAVAAGIAAVRRDSEAEAAAIARVRELEHEMNDAVSIHSVNKPDLEAPKVLKQDVRNAKRAVFTANEALEAAIDDEGSDSEDAATARDELITAKEAFAAAKRAHAANLVALVRLKASHFPEIDVAPQVKAKLDGQLRRAGLVVDNFAIDEIEGYEVLQGTGHGTVIAAKLAGADVVLKEYRLNNDSLRVLQREAGLLHRLRHPNVVELQAVLVSENGTTVHLQMPRYAGGTLEEWLKATSPPAELVRAMMHQLLSAVAHLHASHVIHSDIHPSNIFMDDTSGAWALRLGDFDVSLDLTARTQVMATAAGATLIGGREAYLPPEVKPPMSQPATRAADLYSVGVLFGWLMRAVPGLETPGLLELHEHLTSDNPEGRPSALDAQQHACFTTEEATRRRQLDSEHRAFADSVMALAAQQAEHAKKAAAVAELKAAAQAKQAELAKEQAKITALRKASKRENAEVQRRAAAAAKAKADLQAEMQTVAAEAAAVQALRQKVEADRKTLKAQQTPVPGYWNHKDLGKTHFELVQSRFMVSRLQALMRTTPMHPSGCAGGQSLSNVTVTRVHRIENTVLWKNYTHRKAVMLELSKGSRPAAVTATGHETIEADANELFLFHGTAPDTARVIAKNGFDERVGALTGLYGGGCYFAENSCKSNQYARVTTPAGERTMLYCRVLMGDAYRTSANLREARRAPDKPGSGGAAFDSVLASGGAQVHREFIVYDRNQVYPEFIIYYKA